LTALPGIRHDCGSGRCLLQAGDVPNGLPVQSARCTTREAQDDKARFHTRTRSSATRSIETRRAIKARALRDMAPWSTDLEMNWDIASANASG